MMSKKLVIIANPYPWVSQSGGATSDGMSKKQVLMPLSFASILGGTCTLIGTSTNLVVTGMLETWAKENKENIGAEKVDIGLFDLGKYGG